MTNDLRAGGADQEAEPLVIVCAYADGILAGSWFRAYKRVKQVMKRGSFRAQVLLTPIGELPPRVDLLISPESLREAAEAAPGIPELLITTPERMEAAFATVVDRLIHDGRLARGRTPARDVAVHRGFRALTGRARFVD